MSDGKPAASEPPAATSDPTRLYRAKTAVRSRSATSFDIAACSSGRKTLTSPLEGFSVPTTAISNNGQKAVNHANPMPVAAISIAAAISIERK